MRGEHRRPPESRTATLGSSPHARGARGSESRPRGQIGLIPACAGSTGVVVRIPTHRPAHPRMRGEHDFERLFGARAPGSSPHARGAPLTLGISEPLSGLIPACAGSTLPYVRPSEVSWAHPRMRGEHFLHMLAHCGGRGSSPHARGAPVKVNIREHVPGLIPACAGSTPGPVPTRTPRRAHPRMRGEHSADMAYTPTRTGSSPHARGARAFCIVMQ